MDDVVGLVRDARQTFLGLLLGLGIDVLTLLGAGGGWAVGTIVAPNIKGDKEIEQAKDAEAKKKAEE
ncbi:hypothetical protein ACCS53_39045, partial [Rhizobium ruizarguesonis]